MEKLSSKLNKIALMIKQQLKNTKRYKRLYKVGTNNIFLIISQDISGYTEQKQKETFNKLKKQLQSIPNYIETKIDFQKIYTKKIGNHIFAIGRYQITNFLDDESRKIILTLKNLYFKQKEDQNLKPRNTFTISTQCPFY